MLESLRQVVFLSMTLVKRACSAVLLILKTSLFVASAMQVQVAGLVLVVGLLEVEVAQLSNFGEFGRSLLQLEEVVVGSLDSLVAIGILAFFLGANVTKTIDLALVASSFLLKFLKLKRSVVDVFPDGVAGVTLALEVTLQTENISFASIDLLSQGSDLNLHVVVSTALIVEMEAGVVALLLESVEGDHVRVLASLELVFLKQLLVLKVAELGLDRVKLVPQSEVVLVALLDFENLCLQLANEQVFLVASQVYTVVVLYARRLLWGRKGLLWT